jgi:DNA invertase Pin-like site-specific DNA recombinase
MRVAIYTSQTEPNPNLLSDLRRAVEAGGDMMAGLFIDDGRITGRGKFAGWNTLVHDLDQVDQIVVANVGDLPGRTVHDLLKLLATFRDRGVNLVFNDLRIDTSSAGFDMLALIRSFRAAKLSQAIRDSQMRARAAGKRIGRPVIPAGVLSRVIAWLAEGAGVRPTARRFGVSPSSVINIRRLMTTGHPARTSRDCRDDLVA